MTNEQAKSELMQIYMSLSEEKKKALDVLMAQADGDIITALCSLPKIISEDGQDYVQLFDVLETVRRYLGDCISRTEAIKTIQQHGVGCFDADEFTPEQCERYVIKLLQNLKPSVAIPSAEPYKGMTNGEVIRMLYPQGEIVNGLYGISGNPLICVNLNISTECSEMVLTEDWWNSPYEPQESEG